MMRAAVAVAAFTVLSACAPGEDGTCIALAANGHYCLQPTSAGGSFAQQQKVVVSAGDRHETLIAEVSNDANRFRIIGLTPFGHKVLDLAFDNHEILATTPPDARLPPELMLALVQFALWPADALRGGMKGALTLAEDGPTRRLLADGTPLVSIEYADPAARRSLRMTLHRAEVVIDIETLEPFAEQ